ncbi:MAG: bifunctional proline dehydrogenase/L-glutamate gamma-semialdehyde dehydrogenase [Candidatus Omnitrophica bacterium]|nr:bifunctional proline dehydrogenase/L-glutamate gamma-semialdehyde dehydrogenase [Candidatus Omnitrophota bacterium]
MDTEVRTQTLGHALLERAQAAQAKAAQGQAWERRVLEWCMQDPELKNQILRFVDVLPALSTPLSVAQHLKAYFPRRQQRLPAALRIGLTAARPSVLTAGAVASLTRQTVHRMARLFIAGETLADARNALLELAQQKMTVTLDPLGEAVTSDTEADAYLQRSLKLVKEMAELSKIDPHLMPHLSIKLSSMDPHFDPIAPHRVAATIAKRLGALLRHAEAFGAFINIDLEHYELRDLTFEAVRKLVDEQFPRLTQFGLVIQSYFQDSDHFTDRVIEWARKRKRPLTVRLVKGAYWDTEVVLARQRNWPIPVFTDKQETDRRFETLTRRLFEAHPCINVAIATHNIRSIAHAAAAAETLGIAQETWEFQMLYGMADSIKAALVEMGHPLRIYAPVGPLIPGMAYLVRRLLENSANESFLRHQTLQDQPAEELLKPPESSSCGKETTCNESSAFQNEPAADFSNPIHRQSMEEALKKVRQDQGRRWPLVIGKSRLTTDLWMSSRNPSHPKEIAGHVAKAERQHAEMAVKAASEAFPAWKALPPAGRAVIFKQVAQRMRQKRFELAAWEILETGKTWREADADVSEAVDFIEYYGAQIRSWGPEALISPPGERNHLRREPLGAGVVIAPWNFPLAIPVGMTVAAALTGNTVILKPAEQSSAVIAQWVDLLPESGCPPGVVNLLTGIGEEIGPPLIKHPKVRFVSFTGSKAVGLQIASAAGFKRTILEMGGKNAVIVDEDADLDEAILGTLASAFGHQGQKCSACSRIIVLDSVYDSFIRRLTEAARSLRMGPAEDPATHLGPVIDDAARHRILSAIAAGEKEARLLLKIDPPAGLEGYFVGPVIFTDVPVHAKIAQEEIFGPVLCVFRAKTIAAAFAIANDVEYGLTGGIYSRFPPHLREAEDSLEVGNVYLNRKITGAVVGRHPFGGIKFSGMGEKAGAADTLKQYLWSKSVSENTLRHGTNL